MKNLKIHSHIFEITEDKKEDIKIHGLIIDRSNYLFYWILIFGGLLILHTYFSLSYKGQYSYAYYFTLLINCLQMLLYISLIGLVIVTCIIMLSETIENIIYFKKSENNKNKVSGHQINEGDLNEN